MHHRNPRQQVGRIRSGRNRRGQQRTFRDVARGCCGDVIVSGRDIESGKGAICAAHRRCAAGKCPEAASTASIAVLCITGDRADALQQDLCKPHRKLSVLGHYLTGHRADGLGGSRLRRKLREVTLLRPCARRPGKSGQA